MVTKISKRKYEFYVVMKSFILTIFVDAVANIKDFGLNCTLCIQSEELSVVNVVSFSPSTVRHT